MRRRAVTTTFLRNHMLHFFSCFNPQYTKFKKVSSFFSHFSSDPSLSSLPTSHKITKTHFDLSSVDFNGIAQTVLSKFNHLSDMGFAKRENLVDNASLKDLLLDISDVIPALTRRFRMVLMLKPEDILEILMGFQFECERGVIKGRKVESLWGIFKWVSEQDKGFRHLRQSCEVMASMLVRYGMLREVQLLLLVIERQGILVNRNGIFCELVKGYAQASDLERAVLAYDQMKKQCLVPSVSCYSVLIDLLVRMKRTKLACCVCLDMVDVGSNSSDWDKASIENVVRLLCVDGMIREARNLTKKVMASGFVPSCLVLNEIACGYCDKKDFKDLLSFFVETKCSPNVLVGNKMISSLCSNYGTERANFFWLELEHIGFKPDEITFGILIGWCCHEGNLRSAFIYLSEMLSRGLKPVIWSYNALIGAVFKTNIWKHAKDILDDMVDMGITPGLSTFKVLLAGYCKARQFDHAKLMINGMVNHGLIECSPHDDPLSKAFTILGMNPMSVKLKRDNDVGFSKSEFFDNLGNGLYLDTDLDEYEKRVKRIIDDSAIPDFNFLLSNECNNRNFKAAFLLINEMVQWGQEPSLSVFSALIEGLCSSHSNIKACSSLVEKMPRLANQLDEEVLNFLVQAYCKYGLAREGSVILNQMVLRDLTVKNQTYTTLIIRLCKKGNFHDLHDYWNKARNRKWLPNLEDFKSLVECLGHRRMLKEALELFESMLAYYPESRSEILYTSLEKLSFTGFTSVAHLVVEELVQKGCTFDEIAYNHLLIGLCKEKKYSVAFRILDIMLARNFVPRWDVSLILIPQLCRAERLEKAVALRDTVSRKKSTFLFPLHIALMKGFCMTGTVEEAANICRDLLSKGLHPDAEIYSMLFQGYCQAMNLLKAKELLSVLIRKYSSLSISNYRNWVRFMCAEGRITGALNLKELMLVESKPHNLIIYNILFFNLLSCGNTKLVTEFLNELGDKGFPFDKATYNFLVYGFSKCKDMSSCYHLSTMISKGLRPSCRSLHAIMNYLFHIGELNKVLELSREMEVRGWVHGSVVQNAIAEGYISQGKLQEAEHFLDRMADKGLIPNSINYDNLIKRFCCCGRLNKAVDLLNIMLKKGNVPNSMSYDSIIHGLCSWNQLNHAMQFHTEMLDKELKPSTKTWDLLIHKFCQHGQTEEAEKLLISMVQAGETPTRLMYSSIVDRYLFENNLRKASELMQMMQRSGYEPDFDTHWSLISNLSYSNEDDNTDSTQGFLSRLLTGSGFSCKKDYKSKIV